MQSQSNKNKINSSWSRRTEICSQISKEMFILNVVISRAMLHAGSEAMLPSFDSTVRSWLKKPKSVPYSLALCPFCLHFSTSEWMHWLTCTDIYCEGGGSCRKKTPLYNTAYKTQGNCRMAEIIRPVHWQILRTGTRKNSLLYPCKFISSGNFWEDLAGTFLRDANTRHRCCEMSLFCFISVIYAQQQKQSTEHLTWECKDYFSYTINIQSCKSCWQAMEKESYLIFALDSDWTLLCYYLNHLEMKTKWDLSLSSKNSLASAAYSTLRVQSSPPDNRTFTFSWFSAMKF